MKQIYFFLLFFLTISMELNAQQDEYEVSGKDSISFAISNALRLDSTYYPPCILPLEPEAKIPVLTYRFVDFDSGCHAKGARRDLKNGKAIIWFPGGIIGCDFSSKADQEFQNRYHVQFVSPGCSRTGDEDPEGYNAVIFEYLDKKYGTGWRYELRYDAKGFKVPTTSHITTKTALTEQLAHPGKSMAGVISPETDTSVWWYVLPTSGFALLLSLYLIIKRRKK